MKIAVAGTGYVGLSMATLLAQHHSVVAVDVIPEKVDFLFLHMLCTTSVTAILRISWSLWISFSRSLCVRVCCLLTMILMHTWISCRCSRAMCL